MFAAEPAPDALRKQARALHDAGNYKDAYGAYRKLLLDPKADPNRIDDDLRMGIACLQQLGRQEEIDDFREEAIKIHAANPRLLQAAAQTLFQGEHFGFIVAGEFHRGNKRGEGRFVNSLARDRVRGLQLLEQALPLIKKAEQGSGLAAFYLVFADGLLSGGGGHQAWRLQYLTDLKTLPDYEEGYYGFGGPQRGAPVDAEGNPVYHRVPESYEAAQTDGERWRWFLAEAMEVDAKRLPEVLSLLAGFLHQQFGVQTMAEYGWFFQRPENDETRKDESGTYALHTLGEDETIAKLATGIKRFKLPDEFNYIKLYRQVVAAGKGPYGEQALHALAGIFSDRRQYPKAAEQWRQSIAQYGPGDQNWKQQSLNQIIRNWGQFDNAGVQPGGSGATVGFLFRNASRVDFTAHEIKVPELLADVKAYLKSKANQPKANVQLDYSKIDISNVGYRLVQQNETKYLGPQVAKWGLDLEPRPDHFDKRITITTPLQKPGAYLLVGKLKDGNVSRIIVWVSDTVIVKKQLEGGAYYFVADAVTGKPVPKANVEFFGWGIHQAGNNRQQLVTANFAEFTDANGQVIPDAKTLKPDLQWIAIARTQDKRFAFLGFSGVWYGQRHDEVYNQVKVFTITDRPVYRPGQTAKFKFWVRRAQYDQAAPAAEFANRAFQVQIANPQGEVVIKQPYTTDEFGGFEGEITLAKDASLGQFSLNIVDDPAVSGGGSFRVEEYKKPEFEVKVTAPTEPVMLGEKITATIEARYYFGAPVTKARVKYKVLRSSYNERWFPLGPWDWFYGRGYWWFAYDYTWYPGWHHWGCARPAFWWWPVQQDPPEVVAEAELEIGPDGKVELPIDTALAKAMHADQDHQYSITAEVVDESRRTIVGTGNVLVARQPFKVFAWVDRGHYLVGDNVAAHFSAHTLDQKPVEGQGSLTLFRIRYDEKQQPVEVPVQTWELNTDAQGHAVQQLKASEPGQYRLSYKVTDNKEHTIEGGYVFVVRGEGFDGSKFRFNDLELVTDKREYAPGETVKLMVNTNRVEGTVVLFLRPSNGIYLPPQVVRLDGKSTVVDLAVTKKDMPNFFVEAFTVSNGALHSEMREVIVPPEKQVLNVAVTPSSEEYKPGAEAKVTVKVTDLDGQPYAGSTVVTMYDKSVEYISGGSNVPDIREFFWKWRRSHHPQRETNLDWVFYNLLKPNELGMTFLGAFGHSVADDLVALGDSGVRGNRDMAKRGMLGRASATAAPEAEMLQSEMLSSFAFGAGGGLGASGGENGALVQPTVRSNFADTAFWAGALATDKSGVAEVSIKMPENLTGWKIRTWALGNGTRVGEGTAEVVTSKNLLVRMQAPRFFIEKDEVVLSANVHNYLEADKEAEVVLEFDGKLLTAMTDPTQHVTIKAGGEQRVDWRVKVNEPGEAVIRMKALTDEESDAMEMRFPVYVHGMLKTESFTGVIRPLEESAAITIKVPEERRINDSRLEVRYSPTLAGAMVDALPYLVSYPYNTTDTTLCRFLPTVITQNILLRMKLDLKAIQEKRTNLNAQEIGDDPERAKQWKRWNDQNPVFDEAEVRRMAKEGLEQLTEMQLDDGGWGWFSGWGEHSYPHTTAIVVHGLQIAARNDLALIPGTLERGVEWLKKYQAEQVRLLKNAPSKTKPWKESADNLDALIYMVLADADVADAEMREFLYRDRTKLTVYGMTLYGLALHKQGQAEKLAMIMQNVDQYLVEDEENQTAYLKLPNEGWWWYWYGNDVEANAFYLKLLAKTDPQGAKASRLVKYLLNNRKHATYWNSTRDTAFAIEALAEFLVASGEDRPDMTVEIHVDGKKEKEVKITAENLFSFDNKFVLMGDAVTTGEHKIELKRTGKGPVYFSAYLTNFTLEDMITRAGLELKVNRKYYKLVPVDKTIKVAGSRGQAVDQKVEKYRRDVLENLAMLKSGDLVEIELEIDSKNDYEYILFEDLKASGFEPVDLRSGYNSNDLGAYMELRDERVAFFVRRLARGKSSVAYRMRAEIPGQFSALPTKASALYAPELKGNSDELKIVIED